MSKIRNIMKWVSCDGDNCPIPVEKANRCDICPCDNEIIDEAEAEINKIIKDRVYWKEIEETKSLKNDVKALNDILSEKDKKIESLKKA